MRANDKKALHELFDHFESDRLNKDRWFTRNGSGTFGAKLDEFLAGLPSKQPKPLTPTVTTANKQKTPAAVKPVLSLKEEQASFDRLVNELNEALKVLPWIVQHAFVHDACGAWAAAAPGQKKRRDAMWEAKHRGFLEVDDEAEDDEEICFKPTSASQRARNVYNCLTRLKEFLEGASPAFHLAYEEAHGFVAATNLYPFWEEHVSTPPSPEEGSAASGVPTKPG